MVIGRRPSQLISVWNASIAEANSATLSPIQFAKMFVDTNFAPMIDQKSSR